MNSWSTSSTFGFTYIIYHKNSKRTVRSKDLIKFVNNTRIAQWYVEILIETFAFLIDIQAKSVLHFDSLFENDLDIFHEMNLKDPNKEYFQTFFSIDIRYSSLKILIFAESSSEQGNLSTEQYLSNEPIPSDEKRYFDECKEYYHLTEKPLISIAEEMLNDNHDELASVSLNFGVDVGCHELNLGEFLTKVCEILNLDLNEITVKRI